MIGDIEGFGADPNWPGLWDARLSEQTTYENIGAVEIGPFMVRPGFSFVRSGAGQDPDCGARFLGVFPAVGCASAPWGWGDPRSQLALELGREPVWRGEWFTHGAWTMAHHFSGPQFDRYEAEVAGRTDLHFYQSNIFTSECQPYQACADTGTWGGGGVMLSVAHTPTPGQNATHEDLRVPPRLGPGVHWNSPEEFASWTTTTDGRTGRLIHGSEIPSRDAERRWANTERKIRYVTVKAGAKAISPQIPFDPELHYLIAVRVRGARSPRLQLSLYQNGQTRWSVAVPVGETWSVQVIRLDQAAGMLTRGPAHVVLELENGAVDIDFLRVGY